MAGDQVLETRPSALRSLAFLFVDPGVPGLLDHLDAEHPHGDDGCPGCVAGEIEGPCPVRPLVEWLLRVRDQIGA